MGPSTCSWSEAGGAAAAFSAAAGAALAGSDGASSVPARRRSMTLKPFSSGFSALPATLVLVVVQGGGNRLGLVGHVGELLDAPLELLLGDDAAAHQARGKSPV